MGAKGKARHYCRRNRELWKRILESHKTVCQDRTDQSETDRGWHEGTNDFTPFVKYILRIILSAYRDFENRINLVDEKLPAKEQVRNAIKEKIGKFTKSEIMELVPTIGKASVENSLKELVKEGAIERHGNGRTTFYTRI